MTEPAAIQAPLVESAAVELAKDSRLFRKTILRQGEINYEGRRLKFSPAYLDGLAQAYRDHAFDAVHLTFADDRNRHNLSPEWVRGEVIGVERTPDGLDAIVRASNDAAAQLLRDNPKIGVSARIVPDLERADGKRWPAAIHHVAATTDPRVNALGPWVPVDLATDDRTVIDLSGYDFAGPGETADPPNDEEGQMALTEEDVARIVRSVLAETPTPPPDKSDGQMPSDEELAEIAAGLFGDDEWNTATTGTETKAEPEAEAEAEPKVEATALSAEHAQALELANSRIDAQSIELARWRERAEKADYEAERDRLVRDHGIPPHVVELARPLLLGSHTVELSNGSDVDAGDVVRKVMTALAEHTSMVDLSRSTVWDGDAAARTAADDQARAADAADYVTKFGL